MVVDFVASPCFGSVHGAFSGAAEPVGPGAHPEVHAALDRLEAMGREIHDPVDSTEVIRQMRDNR